MRKINFTIILILLTAFFAVSQSNAQAVHDKWIIPVTCDMGLWVWCLEEPVSGTIVYNVIDRYDKDGNYTGGHFNTKGGKLVGCNTGKVYKVMDSLNETVKFNKNNESQVMNLTSKFKIVAKKGEKYIVTFKGHLTITPNGEVKVDYYDVEWCD